MWPARLIDNHWVNEENFVGLQILHAYFFANSSRSLR
jgi:hypothetical protein